MHKERSTVNHRDAARRADDALGIATYRVSDRLARLYAAASCYVYPSPEEDEGMGVVEAMAAATLVVAWNAAGPTGTVGGGVTGCLVEPGDETAFAERIAELVCDDALARRLGAATPQRVRACFTLDGHLDALEEALAGAVHG